MSGVIDVLENELGLDIPVGLRKMINTKHLNYCTAQMLRLYL